MTQDLPIMSALTREMKWREQNQQVIAENIANADTPGYSAKELKPLDFSDMLKNSASKLPMQSAGMAVTNPHHISSSGLSASSATAKEKPNKNPYEVSPTGNGVILEQQVMELGKNAAQHDYVAAEYQKQMQLLKQATK